MVLMAKFSKKFANASISGPMKTTEMKQWLLKFCFSYVVFQLKFLLFFQMVCTRQPWLKLMLETWMTTDQSSTLHHTALTWHPVVNKARKWLLLRQRIRIRGLLEPWRTQSAVEILRDILVLAKRQVTTGLLWQLHSEIFWKLGLVWP